MANESPYAKALTVYLLAPEIREPLDAIASEPFPDLHSLNVVSGSEWVLCIRNSKGRRPDWTELFRPIFDVRYFGFTSSVSALLIIPNDGRLWALTFGHGRFLLREGVIEERFGLRVALNAIDGEKVRAIDKETFDSLAAQSRQQAIQDTELDNFGIDVDRDLLYAVAGVPSEKALGRRLAGRDSLCASVKLPIEEIPSYLSLLLAVHASDAYKTEKKLGWIDNIYEVRDKAQRRTLDDQLVEKLCPGRLEGAWLALPEIVDWQNTKDFRYLNPNSKFTIADTHLRTFLDSFGQGRITLDTLALKRSRIVCLDHNDEKLQGWSAYKCLYAEIPVGADVFLLTGGHWYKIHRDIVTEISAWYNDLVIDYALMLEMLSGEWEDDYNRRIGILPGYRLFHGAPIYLAANRGPIEFCDLAVATETKCDLIHVKRFGFSSKLSHLFYQGTNSARLFKTSPEFRNALGASIEDDNELARRLTTEPARSDYRVVFAIASSSSGCLKLPLFSKLSLRQALRELGGLGFQAAVAKIAVPPTERMMERGRSVRKTF